MPNLRKAKSKTVNMKHGEKELFYAYLMILIILHSFYKKCDVDHIIVIFLLNLKAINRICHHTEYVIFQTSSQKFFHE